MDFLSIILIFFVGFIMGWFRASKSMLDRMLEKPETMMELLRKYKDAKDEVDSENKLTEGRKIRVERHGEMLYLFAEDNDEFLAQGTSLQEALALVEKRFPNKTFVGHLDKDQADTLGITVK